MKKVNSYLFVTIDGGGNLPPVFGIAGRLASHGHSVTFLTEPCLKSTIQSQGFRFVPFEKYFTREDRKEDIIKDWNASPLKPDPTIENIALGPAKIVVEEVIRVIEQDQFDVLLVDCLLPTAIIAGEYFKIPTACLFHMPEYLPGPNRPPGIFGFNPGKTLWGKMRDRILGRLFQKALDKYKASINSIRSSYGLAELEHVVDLLSQCEARFILTLESFDFPIEPPPKNVIYTGPILDDPDWLAPWQNPWPESDQRPLVVVGLSSTFQNQAGVIQNIIDALSKMKVRGLVTLGLAMENKIFDVPENVIVVDSASHSKVFPHTDMVITHAGHGTVMRALSHGLPLLCIPMGRDQKDNASKVAYHGCGLKLSPKTSSDKIRSAIHRILEDPEFNKNAQRFQDKIEEVSQKDIVIQELEKLTRRKHLAKA